MQICEACWDTGVWCCVVYFYQTFVCISVVKVYYSMFITLTTCTCNIQCTQEDPFEYLHAALNGVAASVGEDAHVYGDVLLQWDHFQNISLDTSLLFGQNSLDMCQFLKTNHLNKVTNKIWKKQTKQKTTKQIKTKQNQETNKQVKFALIMRKICKNAYIFAKITLTNGYVSCRPPINQNVIYSSQSHRLQRSSVLCVTYCVSSPWLSLATLQLLHILCPMQ